MENIIKGWATTLLGFVMMVAGVLYWMGWMPFQLPEPSNETIPEWIRLGAPFLVGCTFFFLGRSFIEKLLERAWDFIFNRKKTDL